MIIGESIESISFINLNMGDGDGLKCWHSHRKWKQQPARWTQIADLQKCVTKKKLMNQKTFCLCQKIEYFGTSVPFCYYSLLGRVIDFPSRVRVVKKIPSTGRVASTRHSLEVMWHHLKVMLPQTCALTIIVLNLWFNAHLKKTIFKITLEVTILNRCLSTSLNHGTNGSPLEKSKLGVLTMPPSLLALTSYTACHQVEVLTDMMMIVTHLMIRFWSWSYLVEIIPLTYMSHCRLATT